MQSTGLGLFLLPTFLYLLMFLTHTTQCVLHLRALTLLYSSRPCGKRPMAWRLSICIHFLPNIGF